MSVDAQVIARVAPIFRRALQRASALTSSVAPAPPTAGSLADEVNGGTTPGRSGKSSSARPSTSATTNDGPALQGEPVEERGALSTAAGA